MRLLRTLALFAILLAFVGPAPAEVKTETVKFKSGDGQASAFVAVPEGKGPFPVVVVIQEWWGLNEWVKDNAIRLAKQGYVAVAPDLYHGKVTGDPREAGQLLKGLPKDRAMRDLKGAVDYALSLPNVKKDRVGVIGWCMGGGFSINLALADPRIDACVICYGRVPAEADAVKPLNAAVLGVFGAEDKGIPPASVKQFEAALTKAGEKIEKINIYEGAGHGFMREKNGTNPNPEYRAEAAKDAWKQIEAFFAKKLKK